MIPDHVWRAPCAKMRLEGDDPEGGPSNPMNSERCPASAVFANAGTSGVSVMQHLRRFDYTTWFRPEVATAFGSFAARLRPRVGSCPGGWGVRTVRHLAWSFAQGVGGSTCRIDMGVCLFWRRSYCGRLDASAS